MVKVKVIKRYSDVMTKKIHKKGFEFEVDKKRAEHLVKEGVAVILEELVTKEAEEKPAKGSGTAITEGKE